MKGRTLSILYYYIILMLYKYKLIILYYGICVHYISAVNTTLLSVCQVGYDRFYVLSVCVSIP